MRQMTKPDPIGAISHAARMAVVTIVAFMLTAWHILMVAVFLSERHRIEALDAWHLTKRSALNGGKMALLIIPLALQLAIFTIHHWRWKRQLTGPEGQAGNVPMPCPFCGGFVGVEPAEINPDILHIRCLSREDECRVRPWLTTSKRLFAQDLAAWNRRVGGQMGQNGRDALGG